MKNVSIIALNFFFSCNRFKIEKSEKLNIEFEAMNRVFKSDIQNLINKKKMKAFSYFRKKKRFLD